MMRSSRPPPTARNHSWKEQTTFRFLLCLKNNSVKFHSFSIANYQLSMQASNTRSCAQAGLPPFCMQPESNLGHPGCEISMCFPWGCLAWCNPKVWSNWLCSSSHYQLTPVTRKCGLWSVVVQPTEPRCKERNTYRLCQPKWHLVQSLWQVVVNQVPVCNQVVRQLQHCFSQSYIRARKAESKLFQSQNPL